MNQTAADSSSCAEKHSTETVNGTDDQGENKNPKIYIYVYIYIYLYIYEVCIHKKNTQNFKIGSLCFFLQMCPCL